MELKTASTLKKKDKLLKKIKKKFGEEIEAEAKEEEDENDDEDEQEQGPMELTQGLGEDKEEGAEDK